MTAVQGQQQQPTTGPGTQARVEEFKQEIAEMRLRDPATARERMLLRGGVVLMVAGVALTIVAAIVAYSDEGASAPLTQRDWIIRGLIGVALTIVGAAVFLRYSMAQFLRFWLARLSYEQHHQTDRLIEKLDQ
jgi:hypothetical protein